MYKSAIKGVGSYLPEKILSNEELSTIVETSDEWITKRTGIKQRHIAGDNESCADIATASAKRALQNSGIDADRIDAVIVATTTPDNAFPAVATVVAKNLGIKKGMAYDVSAACAGFIFALNSGDNLIKLGQATNVLVIGAEIMSRIMDWTDRNTCVLFGDGAGCVVLSRTEGENSLLSTHIFSNGDYNQDLITKATPNNPDESVRGIDMDGKAVYKFAVKAMADAVNVALDANNYKIEDLNYLVPHQANLRIIESVGDALTLNKDKTIVSLSNHANISAATIPVALDSAVKTGTFKSGDLIALTAMGAGFSWGSALLKWT